MNDIKYKIGGEVMKIRDESDLPKHITYNEYQSLLNEIENYEYTNYLDKKKIPRLKARDKLLVQFAWELGGRISDIINIRTRDIDFREKIITVIVKKRHGFINKVPVSDDLLLSASLYMSTYQNNIPGRLFLISRQRAWKIIHVHGMRLGMDLHPHMFRHGLAIYLLQHGVSDKIIARRLGHSSAATTIKYYMVITPEIEREALRGVLL